MNLPRHPNSVQQRSKRRWYIEFIAFLLISATSGIFLSTATSVRSPIDGWVYGAYLRLHAQTPPEDIVLITVDEPSLNQLGQWPWQRSIHAALLNQLNTSRTKGMFLNFFFVDQAQNPEDDQRLADALNQSQRVVLPVLLSPKNANALQLNAPDNILLYPPLAQFTEQTPTVRTGHVANRPSANGIIDSVQLTIHEKEHNQDIPHAMLALTEQKSEQKTTASTRLIPYIGPAGYFRTYSYVDVLNGNIAATELNNKYLLIGATATGLNDTYPTAWGYMSGVEINANILNGILKNTLITPAAPAVQWGYEWGIALVFLLTLLLMHNRWNFYLLLIAISINFASSYFLLYQWHFWVSPVVALVFCVAVYAAWSWWQLSISWRHIKGRLIEIGNASHRQNNHQHTTEMNKLYGIIHQLEQDQSERIKLSEDNRELISFLSHDMRTPLVNILGVISMHKNNQPEAQANTFTQIKDNVAHALKYAQTLIDFNHIRHNELHIEACNLKYIIDYASELITPQTQQKNIRIERIIPKYSDKWAWADVDGALIERALINILNNAIRHSPADSVIKIQLAHERTPANLAVITITDKGQGMDETTRSQLLSGAGTKKAATQNAHDGTYNFGIGWRIIYSIIVQKHHGTLDIKSTLGQGTSVIIKLPCFEFNVNE